MRTSKLLVIGLLLEVFTALANPSTQVPVSVPVFAPTQGVKESQPSLPNPLHISLYHPNYILPGYYSTAPDRAIYDGNTPEAQSLKHTEVKFQLSLKVPIVSKIDGLPISWYAAYTQLSYWQAYASSAYFRETDYQPETFLEYAWQKTLLYGWQWQLLDVGVLHASNGQGGDLERAWNRVYVRGTFVHNRWVVYLEPWYPIHDHSYNEDNPDMSRYLGYGQTVIGYHWGKQTFSLMLRNYVTSGFARGAAQVAWSFPLTHTIKGFVQVFHGYGQSLIEYNHSTTAVGAGVALNDW